MINYTRSEISPRVDESNQITSFAFAMNATCSDSDITVSIQGTHDVSGLAPKQYSLWTKEEIDAQFELCALENDFKKKLDRKLANKKAAITIEPQDFDYNNAPSSN